jgi:hypothetical protein
MTHPLHVAQFAADRLRERMDAADHHRTARTARTARRAGRAAADRGCTEARLTAPATVPVSGPASRQGVPALAG